MTIRRFSNMAVSVVLFILASVAFGVSSVSADDAVPLCDDINHDACRLMLQTKPDLCNDTALAMSACRKSCGLCPIECYDCSGSVMDYTDCNTTKLCAVGEMCMIKQLDATRDGHREFEMTCEPKEACDGTGLTIPFGRRDVQSRDLSVHCCSDDLCNYPTAPATMSPYIGCTKDIIFLVDETSSQQNSISGQNVMMTDALALLSNLVREINVGPNTAQVSMATYSSVVHKQFQLNQYQTTQDVLNAFNQVRPQTQFSHATSVETVVAISYLIHDAMTAMSGDRAHVPDVVVMITDNASVLDYRAMLATNQLHRLTDDLITIEIGFHNHDRDITQLATNPAHAITIPTTQSLTTDVFKQQVLSLMCA